MKQVPNANATTSKRKHRTLTTLIAIAAIVAILSVSTAAAFQLLDLRTTLGGEDALSSDALTTFEATEEAPTVTLAGENTPHASSDSYHYQLRGDKASGYITATDTIVCAMLDVSRADDSVTPFSQSGLTLGIDGLDAESTFIFDIDNADRLLVYALPENSPKAGDTFTFTVTDGENVTPILDVTLEAPSACQTVTLDAPVTEGDCTLSEVSITECSVTVTGQLSDPDIPLTGSLQMDTPLAISLRNDTIQNFDWETVQEDLAGYLYTADIQPDGSFTATWILNKHWQLCYNGITLCGTEYDLPLYVYPEVEVPEIDTSASEATSAETQDFRFTLDSIIATRNVLYATVDMEPITDWGARQMEQTRLNALELWMTPYTAAPSGGGSLGCRLLDSTEEVSRYLLFYVTDEADVLQAGDTVGFQVSIQEEGDTSPHAYDLFTAELETIAGATASGEIDVYSPDNLIHYTSMEIGSLSIHLEGMVSQDKIGEADVRLEIALNYRDGTTVIPSEDVWYPDPAPADAQYIRGTTTSGDHDGNLMTTVCFSQFLELEQLESITINGVTIPNPYVIG
ncbi:MAG: hypothetical protein PUC06_11640 [Oscillospiraceae bacterium]|nr:hypothetical protein [Oscillospiraceae bacterium]